MDPQTPAPDNDQPDDQQIPASPPANDPPAAPADNTQGTPLPDDHPHNDGGTDATETYHDGEPTEESGSDAGATEDDSSVL